MSKHRNLTKLLLGAGLAATALALPHVADANSYNVLKRLRHADGVGPSGPLIADAAGSLYGLALGGGSNTCRFGCGVVYRISAVGTYTVFYAFKGAGDGYWPSGNLLLDSSGNLYGTTQRGGSKDSGTVFKLAPDGTKTVLHSFRGSPGDGAEPGAGLIADNSGNLYGATVDGGATGTNGGTIFRIAPDGTESVLHSFCALQACADGAQPGARLLLGQNGSLYGTTAFGGEFGNGTVFKLGARGKYTLLHSFGRSPWQDGEVPSAGLIADAAGNLYGTTSAGGLNSEGVVFRITPRGRETVLYGAWGGEAELSLDDEGDLFWASTGGEAAFKLDPAGKASTLYRFSGNAGWGPDTSFLPLNGFLYGATRNGGRGCKSAGCGVVYRLKP
jgi:uncharacterized repeat protein (TIGR03803 family)